MAAERKQAMKKKIRILIIDDSSFFRGVLNMYLSEDSDIEVAGEAQDASQAISKIEELNPDVITLDIEMPGMNGIDFLKKVMPWYGIPVVVVSSVNGIVFDALNAGAVDFVPKPNGKMINGYDLFINELRLKIKISATVNRSILKNMNNYVHGDKQTPRNSGIIAIGASTGGTEAIYQVVKDLPRNTPGIVAVQHMPPVFTRMYAERLNNTCMLEAREAENGDRIIPGRILIAPGDCQMRVRKSQTGLYVECKKEEKVSGHCPSVDVLFQSVAEVAAAGSVGVILTGMGRDGAKGLLEMRKAGARTIGQDEASCVVYGMPKAAYDIGAVEIQLPLNRIPSELMKLMHIS